MNKTNFFQITLLIAFGFVGIIAVLIFGGFLPGFRATTGGSGGTIVVWGTIPEAGLQTLITNINRTYEKSFNIKYVEKKSSTFENDLVEAMASGQGPDLAILPQELLVKHANKIVPIPYTTITARTFQDTYFDGADILMSANGIMALPLAVDPLVMYYNKDLFSTNGIAYPPSNWSDFLRVENALTKKTEAGNLLQYGTALGESFNINNTKEILLTLFIQSGDSITNLNNGSVKVTLGQGSDGKTQSPARSAVQFFTQFSDPTKATYSWNRSLPEAQEAFLGGLLGTYFGFGSEMTTIGAKNPHLYYDLSAVPQRDNAPRYTFGRILTLAVMSSSKKQAYATAAAQVLVGAGSAVVFADISGMAPARRELLAAGTRDPKKDVIYKSALISRAWYDPDPIQSRQIFNDLTTAVTAGRVGPDSAINVARGELQSLIRSL